MSAGQSFEFTEAVTSDLSFVARGDTPEAVFAAAAEALLAASVERPARVEEGVRLGVVLEEPDLELLLMRFLNELIYLRDAEGLVLRAKRLSVERNRGVRLEAEVAGEEFSSRRHGRGAEVKAATAHGLRVCQTGGGWEAAATLDI